MKQSPKDRWNHLVDGAFGVVGCAVLVLLFAGIIHLLILLGQWFWTLNWFSSAVSSIGQFIFEHGDLFEFILVGAFFLWLFITIGIFVYQIVKDGYKYASSNDLFSKSKRICIKVAKIICIILLTGVIIFGIGKCVSDNEYNAEDHIPSRYRN